MASCSAAVLVQRARAAASSGIPRQIYRIKANTPRKTVWPYRGLGNLDSALVVLPFVGELRLLSRGTLGLRLDFPMAAATALDPNVEYRLERGALRLVETLFQPGDVVCLAWKVHSGAGQTRMHHQFRRFEQIVAQHQGGGGLFRQLVALNAPRTPAGSAPDGAQSVRHAPRQRRLLLCQPAA